MTYLLLADENLSTYYYTTHKLDTDKILIYKIEKGRLHSPYQPTKITPKFVPRDNTIS
jgi:hypothetical protein